MRKRRPNAADRILADVFRRLRPGEYKIMVYANDEAIAFTHLPMVKTEGSFCIQLDETKINIVPLVWSKAAA